MNKINSFNIKYKWSKKIIIKFEYLLKLFID